jgi:hypothetical protein
MQELLEKFNLLITNDTVFWFAALAGTGLFALQFALTLFGTSDEGAENAESDAGQFQWLSKQGITGLLMMFGWVGLTCKKEFGMSGSSVIALSLASGLVALFLTGFIFSAARRLRSTGTVFSLDDALGKEATVYQRIPKDGAGKISISLNNFTHEIDALALNGEEIPSFTSVKIIKKADDKTLFVIPLK